MATRFISAFVIMTLYFGPAISQAAIVYDNLGGAVTAVHAGFQNSELGDQVTLGGTERALTEISISYRGDFTDHGLDGDEFVSIQFYENDGIGGIPGTMFYQTALIPILSPSATTSPQVFGDLLTVSLPNVLAPDVFTWSIIRYGMTIPSDTVGLITGGTPTVGSSGDFTWLDNGTGWFQATLTNYHAAISANAVPVPAAAWLFGTALIGLIGVPKSRKAAKTKPS